jgi:hypothetical protein
VSSFSVYIPTYKRYGFVETHNIFPDAYLVCNESEYNHYKNCYPEMKIMACPDSVQGNMGKVRNWIKDNVKTERFVMVDDDVKAILCKEGYRQFKMDREHIYEMIENGFVMCEDLGTVMWGINLNYDPRLYKETTPLSMLNVVLGPFNCHIQDRGLRYDENLPTKEDYDYALQVLHKYHKILRFNKYGYMCGHLENQTGGSITFRRMDMEVEQNEYLVKKWGSRVIRYDMSKSVNPKVSVPLKGV